MNFIRTKSPSKVAMPGRPLSIQKTYEDEDGPQPLVGVDEDGLRSAQRERELVTERPDDYSDQLQNLDKILRQQGFARAQNIITARSRTKWVHRNGSFAETVRTVRGIDLEIRDRNGSLVERWTVSNSS